MKEETFVDETPEQAAERLVPLLRRSFFNLGGITVIIDGQAFRINLGPAFEWEDNYRLPAKS